VFVGVCFCSRIHRSKSGVDDACEISSTEAQGRDDTRLAFDISKQLSSSPFAGKAVSSFPLAAKPTAHSISPKKSPLSSSVGISPRASSGISGAHKFPADRHVNTGSSFMKSDHISRLNFNSVSTSSTSTDLDSATHWLNSFVEARTPGEGFTSPQQPASSFSPLNGIDDMSPPILKPKVRRASQRTPDKSPLVTSSSGDILELGKPSVGLGEPPGYTDSDIIDFESVLSRNFTDTDSEINSTSRKLSVSVIDSDADEQPLCDRLSTKNTKQSSSSRHGSCSSVASDHKNSPKISKPSAKEKASSKSGSRSSKQKAKSPAAAELYEKQRCEQNDAFEAACRLPSTVRGQPSMAHRSSLNSWKVRCLFVCQNYTSKY